MVGGVIYYAREVDTTVIVSLSAIKSEQSTATGKTEAKVKQLLDYLAKKPVAFILFHAYNMILKIHSKSSHLS